MKKERKVINRDLLRVRSLSERIDKVFIEKDNIRLPGPDDRFPPGTEAAALKAAGKIRGARENGASVIIAFGAHAIKNGNAPVLIELMKQGWLTHLATNGAGIIHDWEFAFQGRSSEDVKVNVGEGKFGIWHETGFYINLAIITGAYCGLGYGDSVGKMISEGGLMIPARDSLLKEASEILTADPDKAAAALDLAGTIARFGISPGFMQISHPFKSFSVQAAAWELGIPFTGHPMIGHDIIYNHPLNNGAAVGRTALRDFLSFAGSVLDISNGVYLSVGSAVMSPMIFEKALSMAQNIKIQENSRIHDHYMLVVDLAASDWDWKKSGEPPPDNPAYYLRYCKTFARMGGEMDYLSADNREFLPALYKMLNHH
ncbi:MAG: hypothetical protein MUE32_05755 [Bacteroidales bacterium]|nr:hypothetical protein [Bacteroidales bacterium]